mmetsp:Transcript_34674/g.72727  ORF Transcript_34674/g.72727 Transcript_34674/m.72727 type:complete len:1069 (-) Transcript_34674:659-3865(-)
MKLHGMMERDDQLLCFLPSQKEVIDAVQRMTELNINAKPLYAQQNGAIQMKFLRTAKVFFSTNIAETSLTFPSLRFVVDCGQVQRPRFIGETALMETVPASISTLRQRSGRVGRTMDGDYVALYKKMSQPRQDNISPKMDLERREDLFFSLQCQIKRQVTLDFPALSAPVQLPQLDSSYFRFPVLGGKKMADAFFAAQRDYHCGDEILLLAALRMSFQSKVLQELASKARSMFPMSNGDISCVVSVLRRLDAGVSVADHAAGVRSVVAWCNQHGLSDFCTQLFRAYRNYCKMRAYYQLPPVTRPHNKAHRMFSAVAKTDFDGHGREWNGFLFGRKNPDGSPDMSCAENYERPQRLERCSKFSQVIQALAAGFQNNYFMHCKNLDGPIGYYSRASDLGDGGDSADASDNIKTLSSMHTKSTLAKMKPEVPSIIFALDFMLFGAEMPENETPFRLGVLQLIEKVDSTEEIPSSLHGKRRILVHKDDTVTYPKESQGDKEFCIIEGSLKTVLDKELSLRKELRTELKVSLLAQTDDSLMAAQIKASLEQLKEDRQIFNPLKFLWKNAHGVKVEVNLGNPADPHFNLEGRRQDLNRFSNHFALWRRQLATTPMVERPDHFMAVNLYRRPHTFSEGDEAFRERLHTVTALQLSEIKVFLKCEGPQATRESRMEIVARIAVQVFGCKLCGGFLRDWIVNGEREHLPGPFEDWIEQPAGGYTRFEIKAGVIPKDLDLELPMEKYFDVGRFVSEVRQCGITVDYHEHIAQRHVFLLEKGRGPFTVDLIEPHFAVLHTLADFDVNTMCVVAYQDLIGLKMTYKQSDGRELNVDDVITNCRRKHFITMQHVGSNIMQIREKKMIDRGWTKLGEMIFVPVNPRRDYSVSPVHEKSEVYVKYKREIETRITKGKARLLSMYEIRSSIVDGHYIAMRDEFQKTLGDGNVNEKLLFHGTDDSVVEAILRGGFDDRFWKTSGYFGRGAYFADDPNLSVAFTKAPAGGGPRSFFICSVILGRVDDRSATPIDKPMGADFYPVVGCNSVMGRIKYGAPPVVRETEYIVYRYGQAKPRYLLRFDYQ